MQRKEERRRGNKTGGRRGQQEERAGCNGRGAQGEESETVVCAWWTGYGAQHEKPGGRKVQAHVYTSKLKPTRPLEEGMSVRVLALPAAMCVVPMASTDYYEVYEPHVCGEIIRISTTVEGWARVTVINSCRGNAVGVVDLDIPDVPGVTISRCGPARPARKLEWVGEAPHDAHEWKKAAGRRACEGRRCALEPEDGGGAMSFRAIPKQGKGQTAKKTIEMPKEEGVFALHYWHKYEGY